MSGEHEHWGVEFQAGFDQLPARSPQGEDPDRRLTVAYISPDLFTHSVSYFAEAPLRHHNPDRWATVTTQMPSLLLLGISTTMP